MLITDTDGMQMHVNPRLVKEVYRVATSGGGYVYYMSFIDRDSERIDKEGYEKLVKWMEEHE